MNRCRSNSRTNRGLRSESRRGAAVVECAICLPILVVLTLGICELGQAYKVQAILSEAARKSCATASRSGCSEADVVSDALAVLAANKLPTGAASVTILVNDQPGNILRARKYNKITVTVSIPVSQVNWTKLDAYLGPGAVLSQSMVMSRQS